MSSTLRRYRITYADELGRTGQPDPASPRFTMTMRAYNEEHVYMKWDDADDDTGWVIIKIERVRED